MSTVVEFPQSRRTAREGRLADGAMSATIIILPVVRIERIGDGPSDVPAGATAASGRRRRRPAARS